MSEQRTMYIHMYEEAQCYGGPEEGGWWFDRGIPVSEELWQPLEVVLTHQPTPQRDKYGNRYYLIDPEDKAYAVCRRFNEAEHKRRESLQYGYTSVLSGREEFYTYDVSDDPYPRAYPEYRPHYE